MTNFSYRIVTEDNRESVVAFFEDQDEPIVTADSTHKNWAVIKQGLFDGDASVYRLFNPRETLKKSLTPLSDRVSFDGDQILLDGDPVHTVLADQIKRHVEAGEDDWKPLVAFWENIESNPSRHSKEHLYRWLEAEDFAIDTNGYIVGYKGVQQLSDDGEVTATNNDVAATRYQSVHAGKAFVDGKEVNGHVPNNPGSIVTMPRSEVTADSRIGCHVGLHVGTWSYAVGFGSVVLEVKVNPRDVVSVPTDCGDRKMRVCRYEVVRQLDNKHESTVVRDDVVPAEDYSDFDTDTEYDF